MDGYPFDLEVTIEQTDYILKEELSELDVDKMNRPRTTMVGGRRRVSFLPLCPPLFCAFKTTSARSVELRLSHFFLFLLLLQLGNTALSVVATCTRYLHQYQMLRWQWRR